MWLDMNSTEAHFNDNGGELSEDEGGELPTAGGRSEVGLRGDDDSTTKIAMNCGEQQQEDGGSQVEMRQDSWRDEMQAVYSNYEDGFLPSNFLAEEDVEGTKDVEETEYVKEKKDAEDVERTEEVEGQENLVEESSRHSEDEELEIGYRKRKPEPLPDDSEDEQERENEQDEESGDDDKSENREAPATVKDGLGRTRIATGRSGKGKVFLASSQLCPSTIEEHVNDVRAQWTEDPSLKKDILVLVTDDGGD